MRPSGITLSTVLLLITGCASAQTAPPRETAAPVAVRNILFAQPFTVERPYINTFSRERAKVSSGVLVVLEVDPAYLDPRDAVVNPVLYAGGAAVIRLNRGNESGRVIGIIPGSIDLATEPVWFGSPELPERLTAATVQAERARAERAGIRPFGTERIATIRRAPVRVPDVATLLRNVAAELVLQYSPQEKELADQWRLPEATPRDRRPN